MVDLTIVEAVKALKKAGGVTKHELRIESSFYNIPSAFANKGRSIFVRDVGINGSVWRSDGTRWAPVHGDRITLAQQNYACNDCLDSGTTIVPLFHCHVPINLFTENSSIRLSFKSSWTGDAAIKNLGAYLGNTLWWTYTTGVDATNLGFETSIDLSARNSPSSLIGEPASAAGGSGKQTVAATLITGDNLKAYKEVSVRANFSVAGASTKRIVLESARLEFIYGG